MVERQHLPPDYIEGYAAIQMFGRLPKRVTESLRPEQQLVNEYHWLGHIHGYLEYQMDMLESFSGKYKKRGDLFVHSKAAIELSRSFDLEELHKDSLSNRELYLCAAWCVACSKGTNPLAQELLTTIEKDIQKKRCSVAKFRRSVFADAIVNIDTLRELPTEYSNDRVLETAEMLVFASLYQQATKEVLHEQYGIDVTKTISHAYPYKITYQRRESSLSEQTLNGVSFFQLQPHDISEDVT